MDISIVSGLLGAHPDRTTQRSCGRLVSKFPGVFIIGCLPGLGACLVPGPSARPGRLADHRRRTACSGGRTPLHRQRHARCQQPCCRHMEQGAMAGVRYSPPASPVPSAQPGSSGQPGPTTPQAMNGPGRFVPVGGGQVDVPDRASKRPIFVEPPGKTMGGSRCIAPTMHPRWRGQNARACREVHACTSTPR